MQFGLNESQQILQSNARKFFAAECPMTEVRRIAETETAYDPKLWTKLAEQGYTGAIFPEQYGGLGMGLVEFALLTEEMGRALVPGPFLSTVICGAVHRTRRVGRAEGKPVRPICAGTLRGAGGSRSDPRPRRCVLTNARQRRISGEVFVTDARGAATLPR